MRVDSSSSSFIALANGRQSAAFSGSNLTQLANGSAAAQLGVRPGSVPGSYQPVYETKAKLVKEDITETRDVTRSEAIYEDQAVTETRAVFEDRAVFESRDISATVLEGDRSIASVKSLSQAGIDVGADLALRVGDGSTAVIRFDSKSRITVQTSSGSQSFDFNSGTGSFTKALVAAFESVDGLSASVTDDGRLKLETADAQTLRIADVQNSWYDRSGSPLDALGLDAGTTQAKVVATEQVQVGTERVQVGTETLVTGSMRVKVGEQQIVVGQETVVTGQTTRMEPAKRVLVGLQDSDAPGVGALSILDKLAAGGLPAGYVEALFGILEGHDGQPGEGEVRATYAQSSDEPASTDTALPREDDEQSSALPE